MWRAALVICLLLIFSQALCSPVHAQTVVFTENFDLDFQQWQPLRDDGKAWLLLNGQADVYLSDPHVITEMVPKDEVWQNTWQNLEYELDYIPVSGVDRNISFGVQSSAHWYEIHFVEEFFNLVKVKAGQKPFDINHPFRLENGQTYRLKIVFHTGLIQIFVDGRLIAEEYDASFNNDYGKIGIKVTTGDAYPTHVRFDNIVVREITNDGFKLNVPHLKQNDPLWSEFEYDQAHKWSNDSSFRRWACALTSMVMIMQYHGLTTLPDGELITPLTLNHWLISQPDGYLGEGLVNWIAVTRLTHLISQKWGTSKLEFVFQNERPYASALQELAAGRPPILHIPGHFLVATGHTGNKQDLFINDPFYNFETFFSHQVDLESLRTFIPSQTDLSYILIAHTSSTEVRITDLNSQPLSDLQTTTEFLEASDKTQKGETLTVHYLLKPKDQEFLITLSQPTPQPFSLQIFTYDKTGEVTDLTQRGMNGSEPLTFKLQYHSDNLSSLELQTSWLDLQQQLFLFSQSPQYFYYTTFLELNQIIDWAKSQTLANQQRYVQLFKHRLTGLKPTFDLTVWKFFDLYINHLFTHLSRASP